MSWLYLTLIATALYAIVNLIDDNLLRYVYKSPSFAVLSAGLFGALPLLSLFFLHMNALDTKITVSAIMAGMLIVGFYYFYFSALDTEYPSVVVALLSLAPIFLPVFAHLLLGEELSGGQLIGFSIIVAGSLLMATNSAGGTGRLKLSSAVGPVLIAIFFMDLAALLSKSAYDHADFYSVYMYFSAGMGLGAAGFFIIMFRENSRALDKLVISIRKVAPFFIAAEAIALAGEFALNLAIARGPVSLVKAVEGVQPMFVLLLSLFLYPLSPKHFREAAERNLIRKFLFIALMATGIAIAAR
jgi:drug/metabolite transporter (DMT)-like permease